MQGPGLRWTKQLNVFIRRCRALAWNGRNNWMLFIRRCRALAWNGRNNWMLFIRRCRALAWVGRYNWMFVHTTLHHLMEYVAHVEPIAVRWPWMTSPEESKNTQTLPMLRCCISNCPDSLRNLIGNISIPLKFWTLRSHFQSSNV
jgi:hypothetical protein